MNYQLIENWNSVVQREDVVYHLGDFGFLPAKQTREVIDCLNGKITLIIGNHDTRQFLLHDRVQIVPKLTLQLFETVVTMSHYPEVVAKEADEIGFCGHIHNQWRSWETPDSKLIYNLGVDVWDYHPVNLKDIEDDMANPQNRVIGEWKDAYHD